MPALFLVCAACAPIPEDIRELPESSFIELDQTPFYPQERYQCGPAALTTVLAMSGADVRLDDIVDKVYLPGREGSLQLELIAATRSSGRLPYVIDGTMAAIRKELWAGRPVLILHGRRDTVIPVRHGRRLHSRLPGSTLVEYDCGHQDLPVGSERYWADISSFLWEADVLTPRGLEAESGD